MENGRFFRRSYSSPELKCIGPILIGSVVVRLDASTNELNGRVLGQYELPDDIVFGDEFGAPYIAQSLDGEVLLIESARKFYIARTE